MVQSDSEGAGTGEDWPAREAVGVMPISNLADDSPAIIIQMAAYVFQAVRYLRLKHQHTRVVFFDSVREYISVVLKRSLTMS